ncbi:MAG TPA: hypothetical protein VNI35_05160, partial [Nitrospira sp.]|nr:hypothetical protein [Nitrospira sp.]
MMPTNDARRSAYREIPSVPENEGVALPPEEHRHFEFLDLLYRSLCALLYNYVPMSGHPGGSISAGRFMAALLFDRMDYDLSRPQRDDADLISFAAG